MEINNWIQITCKNMRVRINQRELSALAQMYEMFKDGMAEVNHLELGKLDPTMTSVLEVWKDNEK